MRHVNEKSYNVLFLCTSNSARSIMAEVLLNSLGKGRFKAYSAGSYPMGEAHPLAIAELHKHSHRTEGLRSKSWDEFAQPDAPVMDFVFTVCDKAAGEVCPVWPGQPVTAHWGFADPATAAGSDAKRREAFTRVYLEIRTRIQLFLALPLDKLDRMSIQQQVRAMGNAPK